MFATYVKNLFEVLFGHFKTFLDVLKCHKSGPMFATYVENFLGPFLDILKRFEAQNAGFASGTGFYVKKSSHGL